MTSPRTPTLLLVLASALLAPFLAAPPTSAQIIIDTPSTTTLVVEPADASPIGTQLTLTATVSENPGPPIGEGWVSFEDGDETIGTAEVDETGDASITYTPPTVGTHELTAVYSGSPPNFDASSSAPVEHTVTGDPPLVPEVQLHAVPSDRAPAGSGVQLAAEVDGALQDPRVRGTVVFYDGAVAIGSGEVTIDYDLAYAADWVVLPQGVRHLSARYVGNLPEIGPSESGVLTYSSLPETCADQAVPGQGALVRLAYQGILRRCPDPAGFAYWTQYLDAGGNPATVTHNLLRGAEGTAATVDAAYRQVLGRPSDPAGRAVWTAKLRAGWTTSQLWAALAASPEFVSGGASVVDRAFERLVGRPVDEPSRAYWTARLSSGPRSGALRALILTPEALGRIVDGAHLAARGWRPDASMQIELQADIKARRGDWRSVIAALFSSAFGHAQTYPDPAG